MLMRPEDITRALIGRLVMIQQPGNGAPPPPSPPPPPPLLYSYARSWLSSEPACHASLLFVLTQPT